jgi:hypothetical protein
MRKEIMPGRSKDLMGFNAAWWVLLVVVVIVVAIAPFPWW